MSQLHGPLVDVGIVFSREIRPQLRNPVGLLFDMIQPLIFLVLFGSLLAGMAWGGEGSPWQWFVPGILVMMGLSATGSSGYMLLTEMGSGSLDRLLVTPLNRASILVGRTMKQALTLLAQAVLIVGVLLPFGFELHLAGAVAGMLMLITFGVGLDALSCAMAIAVRRNESVFWVVQQTLLFPLLLLSGVLLPLDTAPSWLYRVSRVNPLTYVVEAERALFAGDFSPDSVRYGAVTAALTAVVGVLTGARAMRHATL